MGQQQLTFDDSPVECRRPDSTRRRRWSQRAGAPAATGARDRVRRGAGRAAADASCAYRLRRMWNRFRFHCGGAARQ